MVRRCRPFAASRWLRCCLDLSLAGIERTVTADCSDAVRTPVDGRGCAALAIKVPARSHRFVTFRR